MMMINDLLEGLDTFRPTLLANKTREKEFRSLLRQMVSALENLQNTPSIEPELHQHIVSLLAALLDAEHGTLLKHMHSSDDTTHLFSLFDAHIKQRKVLLDAAQQDLPIALTTVRHSFDLIGKPQPETDDLSTNFKQFEQQLREYLKGNSKVRLEFNLLTSALKESVSFMDHVLEDVGSDSPELKEVEQALSQDLPTDPEQAQALLRQARSSIIKAGEKLNHASQQVKETMTEQMKQMNSLSERLQQAEAQARNDPLTGLANRRKLREYFSELDEHHSSIFLMIDIDFFKRINDQYGHDTGDTVLEKLGHLLNDSIRSTDMAARLGGEEFCIVLPEANAEQGQSLGEKIRQTVEKEIFPSPHGNIDVKISIGVSERSADESIASWLKRADEALYSAKQGGRNQVVVAK